MDIDIGFALVLMAAFIAVVLLIEGLFSFWAAYKSPEVQRLERRLRVLSAGGRHGDNAVSLLKGSNREEAGVFERVVLALPRVSALDRMIRQSGTDTTLPRLAMQTILSFVAVLLGSLVFRLPAFVALVLASLCAAIPLAVMLSRRRRRLRAFEEQFPDAVEMIARALRAGHALPSALQMVAEESADPCGEEFQATFDEVNYGVSISNALENMVTRVPLDDLRYFAIAIILQRDTGGNLAEILDNISALIRDRFRLLGKVRALSAEGRLSAWILSLLPPITAMLLYVINPKLMSVLWTDPAGLYLIYGAVAMMVAGIFWMSRIVDIRV